MRVTVGDGFQYFHRHGDIGPDSRDHPHLARITVTMAVRFNAKTGEAERADDLGRVVHNLVDEYRGKNLNAIPALQPTLPSLALRMHEQLLVLDPTIHLVLTDEELSVEVP